MSDNGILDLEFAKLDISREERTGFPEVVFCSGKSDADLTGIYSSLMEKNGSVLGTRATEHQAEVIGRSLPDVTYDHVSRLLTAGKLTDEQTGCIAVVTAGTSDIPVAEEAAGTCRFFGSGVKKFYDVGVAGMHRLLSCVDEIRTANAVIAVAGMEGALPSVLGGLVRVPVIAVPTSVGYGANFEGITPLLAMMNSCANGVSVVNIDNGYGAGYIATQINRLAQR